jgi:plastocyanin
VPPRGSDMVTGPPMAANATGATTGVNATELGPETAEGEGLPVTNVTGTNATEAAGTNVSEAAGTNVSETAVANATEAAGTTAETGATDSNATEAGSAAGTGATGGEGGSTTTGVSIGPGSSTLTTDAFQPNPVQVSTGTTVTWTNEDAQPHTVMSGATPPTPDGKFDSGIMAPAATFDFTFTEAGEYPYFCLLHPNMVGSVSVS